ncbi:MAG: divalent-cation tolerance protein CutA [Gammaproteobacteria bacterium]|nr:divalent-cation tolerance protein CutA [Gammaproteobacteria bacterium]NBT44329.1 divalent-cation tolerance protein CutA [Gammaproteobacteria bacterium]NBY22891.1 divalent-cation tolerance protein CutA [Gammaproteobacteria bacterium]NDE33973.1 divalent-cation tolerance protein CutA [Gammaproteobacteria bacterium]NDE55873.1 divalent-cation tolerance protein CutA [Gammaproteobacteria bacterium]
MSSSAVVVLSSCPDVDTARRLARGVIESGMAACVSIVPGVESIYRWKGQLESQEEHLLLIKTVLASLESLTAWLEEHHPYELPEIIALPMTGGSERYLQWLRSDLDSMVVS